MKDMQLIPRNMLMLCFITASIIKCHVLLQSLFFTFDMTCKYVTTYSLALGSIITLHYIHDNILQIKFTIFTIKTIPVKMEWEFYIGVCSHPLYLAAQPTTLDLSSRGTLASWENYLCLVVLDNLSGLRLTLAAELLEIAAIGQNN